VDGVKRDKASGGERVWRTHAHLASRSPAALLFVYVHFAAFRAPCRKRHRGGSALISAAAAASSHASSRRLGMKAYMCAHARRAHSRTAASAGSPLWRFCRALLRRRRRSSLSALRHHSNAGRRNGISYGHGALGGGIAVGIFDRIASIAVARRVSGVTAHWRRSGAKRAGRKCRGARAGALERA